MLFTSAFPSYPSSHNFLRTPQELFFCSGNVFNQMKHILCLLACLHVLPWKRKARLKRSLLTLSCVGNHRLCFRAGGSIKVSTDVLIRLDREKIYNPRPFILPFISSGRLFNRDSDSHSIEHFSVPTVPALHFNPNWNPVIHPDLNHFLS